MRSSIFFLVAILMLLGVAASAQEPASEPSAATPAPAPYLVSEPRELFARGVELTQGGAIQEAKAVFRALTLAHPELPEPHINLAVLLAAEGDAEESAQEIEAALRAHPLCRAAFDLELQLQLSGATAPGAAPAAPAIATRTPPAVTALAGSTVHAGSFRVVRQAADPCLNFRLEPSAGSAALECLAPGTRVRWLETDGDWSRVALRDGREGWMAAAFLASSEP